MKYKNFDSQEFLNAFYTITLTKSDKGVDMINTRTLNFFVSFLSQKGFRNLAALFAYALDNDRVYVDIAQKTITVEGGKLKTNVEALPQSLKQLSEFGELSQELGGVSLSVPVIGEILAVLGVLFSVINLFSNEAKTKGDEEKEKMKSVRDGYDAFWNNYKNSGRPLNKKPEALAKAFSAVTMQYLFNLQPKCQTGTINCSKEHLQYALRCRYTVELCAAVVNIVSKYWNDENWKEFIDNYQAIEAQISGLNIPNTNPPSLIPPTPEEQKAGLGGLIIPVGIGLAALKFLK